MIDSYKLKQWLYEEMDAEKRFMTLCDNQNSPGMAMAIGMHDAYARVLDYIEGKLDD
jgi:hypothetical protein